MRVVLAAFLFLVCALAGAQPYLIDRFDVRMSLSKDAQLLVEEKIAVSFVEARRGIFRVIPIEYDNGRGLTRQIWIDQVNVTDDAGNALTTKVKKEGTNLRIRIGDEKVYLSPGTRKTYVIRYRCRGMMNWFSETEGWGATAELYWNATGDEWDTTIGAMSCRIDFPSVSDGKQLRAKIFAGPYGSRVNQIIQKVGRGAFSPDTQTTTTLAASSITVSREAPLPSYSGVTVVLDMPEGLIAKPGPVEAAWLILSANLGFLIPLLVLPALVFSWFRYGRDPDPGPLVTQFDPPEDLSGPASGTILDERVDPRDISAGVFSLAIKGYLTMEPDEEGLIFKRRTAKMHVVKDVPGPDLSPFEATLFSRLRACGATVEDSDLRANVATHLVQLKSALYEELVHKGYYLTSPETARVAWMVGGVLVVGALGVVATLMTPYHNPMPAIVGGVVSIILVALFSRGMPRRTRQGAIARRQVEGFEEFIRRARGGEIDWMAKQAPTPALFEKYLPHAIAFGLAAEWGALFDGIVTEPPSWYLAPRGYGFYPSAFGRDMSSVSSSIGAAAATPPRSSGASGGGSGFGGGGFSGGGFGGGGGGSW